MNLLDIVAKAKTAKRKGKEFEFAGTGAIFEFRGLSMDELAEFVAASQAEISETEKVRILADQITKLLQLDTVVGWRNLTQELFERVAQLERIEGTDPGELIVYESGQSASANELIRLMARNSEFAVFVSTSVLSATNDQKIAADEKKTT